MFGFQFDFILGKNVLSHPGDWVSVYVSVHHYGMFLAVASESYKAHFQVFVGEWLPDMLVFVPCFDGSPHCC